MRILPITEKRLDGLISGLKIATEAVGQLTNNRSEYVRKIYQNNKEWIDPEVLSETLKNDASFMNLSTWQALTLIDQKYYLLENDKQADIKQYRGLRTSLLHW